jgi:type IV pilus assembly protein PilV
MPAYSGDLAIIKSIILHMDWCPMTKPGGAGFSLIEVLIAVLVLALGVIGAAGMQLTALRTTQQSTFQTTALELAAEMADKMRANASQMKQADNLFLKVDYQSATGTDPAAPEKLCYSKTASCGADELAKFDIYEWETRVKANLPGGRALICRDSAPWDSDVGALTWTCAKSSADSTGLVIKIGWQARNPDGSLIRDAAKKFPPSVALSVGP